MGPWKEIAVDAAVEREHLAYIWQSIQELNWLWLAVHLKERDQR